MRGHLQERGEGSWRIKVYVGRSAEGRKRYVERTVRGTRREAEREMARLIVEVDEGRHAAAAPLTFGELLNRWLAVKRLAVEPTTVSSYEWVALKYLRPALGDRKVAALRPIELDSLYAELRGSGLSARTVWICHTVVRQSLEQARKWGLIARSPAVDATPPPQTRRSGTVARRCWRRRYVAVPCSHTGRSVAKVAVHGDAKPPRRSSLLCRRRAFHVWIATALGSFGESEGWRMAQ